MVSYSVFRVPRRRAHREFDAPEPSAFVEEDLLRDASEDSGDGLVDHFATRSFATFQVRPPNPTVLALIHLRFLFAPSTAGIRSADPVGGVGELLCRRCDTPVPTIWQRDCLLQRSKAEALVVEVPKSGRGSSALPILAALGDSSE